MAHQVREITIRLVVDDDGPAMDSIGEALFEGSPHWPDWLVEVETVDEETRDATGGECGSMGWDTPCSTCGKDADESIDGDCPDCNPPVGGD